MWASEVRSGRDGGEGTSRGRPLARSELELAEKIRQYSLPLNLCGIRVFLVRGIARGWSCALLLWASEWHRRGDEGKGRGVRMSEDEQRRRGTG